MDELDVDPKRFAPRGIRRQISEAKNQLLDAEAYRLKVSTFFEQTAADVYDLYEKRLHAANAMDFDDLLFRCVNLFELFEEVRNRYRRSFRHVLVDEYQDTNRAQYRWLQLLTEEHRNLCVVGDDDQCLIAGTPITMADGTTKPIEDVEAGDEVLSNYGSGDLRPARVLRIHRSTATEGVVITTAGARRLISTPEHVHFAGESAAVRQGPATITLCGADRGGPPAHLVTIGGHRAECSDYGEALALVTRVVGRTSTVSETIRLGARSLQFMPAVSVCPGMAMFAEDGVVRRGGAGRADPARRGGVRPRCRAHPQLLRQRASHAQLDLRASAEPTSRTSSASSGTTPTPRWSSSSRTTARRRRSSTRPNGVISNNRQRKDKFLWSDIGEGRSGSRPGARGRARGGAVRGVGDRAARRGGRVA